MRNNSLFPRTNKHKEDFMEIIVTASYEQNGKTVSIKAREQMENENEDKIRMVQNVIERFIPEGQPFQRELQCLQTPPTASPMQATESVAKSKSVSSKKRDEHITGPQLHTLKDILEKRNISEEDFYKKYHYHVEETPKEEARWIIRELLGKC